MVPGYKSRAVAVSLGNFSYRYLKIAGRHRRFEAGATRTHYGFQEVRTIDAKQFNSRVVLVFLPSHHVSSEFFIVS